MVGDIEVASDSVGTYLELVIIIISSVNFVYLAKLLHIYSSYQQVPGTYYNLYTRCFPVKYIASCVVADQNDI